MNQLPLELVGGEDTRKKMCLACKKIKLITQFPHHINRHGDEYENRCKKCKRKRDAFVKQVKIHAPPKTEFCQRPTCIRKAEACDHDPKIDDPVLAFRGWLCHHCNRSLGQLGDDIESVAGLYEYLVRHKKRVGFI